MQAALDIDDLTSAAPLVLTLTPHDLADLADELQAYHAPFAPLFQRREQREWAEVYLRGLLLTDVPRTNVEAMALRLRGAGPAAARTVRALQQFVSEGAWDDAALLSAHQDLVEETLGEDDGVFIIGNQAWHATHIRQLLTELTCQVRAGIPFSEAASRLDGGCLTGTATNA